MSAGQRVRGQERGSIAAGAVWVPPSVRPFVAVGVATVVVGGLVAAVSRPAGWERGPWLAAFLVLVVGVGQTGLAIGQSVANQGVVSGRIIVAELALGNAGALLVVVGTLAASPVFATVGSLVFTSAVAVFARHSYGGHLRSGSARWSYMALLVTLAVSVPIGIALSWLRT